MCNSPYSGLNCETNTGPPCKNGLYRAPEKCDPCVCDREGSISSNICDYRTGTCNCRVSCEHIKQNASPKSIIIACTV